MTPNFYRLIAAQFFSSLADNALLIVAIALLEFKDMPGWWAPMLKFFFTVSYVVLAPWIGPLADGRPKSRLMAWMNLVKIAGLVALMWGCHPLAAFVVVGFGAAGYAPAKYGLITELVPSEQLVLANSWLEVSVVCSVLLGAILGGVLISPLFEPVAQVMSQSALAMLGESMPLQSALVCVLCLYGLASLINVFIQGSGKVYGKQRLHVAHALRNFWMDNRKLWTDKDGGLSLAATTVFWGGGATVQFAVLKWASDQLGLPLSQAAYLQAAVAVGVVFGAAYAGRRIALTQAKHMLWAGVGLGLLLMLISQVHITWLALPILVLAGVMGGLLVVPLNALLQYRGCALLSAGRSIAVQGYNENLSVLLMLGVYAAMIGLGMPIGVVLVIYGVAITAAILWLIKRSKRA
jgi:MFS family permease